MPSILRVSGWRWLEGHGGDLSLHVGNWLFRRSPDGFRMSAVRNGDSVSNFGREVCFCLRLQTVGFTLFYIFIFLVWSWYLFRFIDSFFGNSYEI